MNAKPIAQKYTTAGNSLLFFSIIVVVAVFETLILRIDFLLNSDVFRMIFR
jgi:hypothetical protein